MQTETDVEKAGIKNYSWLAVVVFLILLGAWMAIALAVYLYDKTSTQDQPTESEDYAQALDAIGDDSVYQFFLGKTLPGWAVALLVIAAQVAILALFVKGAEIDLSDDKSDLVYTYQCPRDKIECEDKNDLDWRGTPFL